MKLNSTPRHYMLLSQNQSDDDESGPIKESNSNEVIFQKSRSSSEKFLKKITEDEDKNFRNLPMSPLRKTCLIISLFFCVLFVLIFVYCIPCTMLQNKLCQVTYQWERTFHNMTLSSSVAVVDHGQPSNSLVVLGYITKEPGIMAIQLSDGKESWHLQLHSPPLFISCNILDVNLDKSMECLVIGNDGLMAAVDAKTGSSFWYLHNHSDLNKAYHIDGPALISDLDNDGIQDILVTYSISNRENTSHLAIVSGGTGEILGSLIELVPCSGPALIKFTWTYGNESYFSIFCPANESYNLWMLTLNEVRSAYENKMEQLHLKTVIRKFSSAENSQFYKIKSSKENLFVMYDGSHLTLSLINSPQDASLLWKTPVNRNKALKILNDGRFMNKSIQLVVSVCESSFSKIYGLALTDGTEMWSTIIHNGTITAATIMPDFFCDSDGLLLKVLTDDDAIDFESTDEMWSNVSYSMRKQSSPINRHTEKFIVLKCTGTIIQKPLFSNDLTVFSEDNGLFCCADLYNATSTVVIQEGVRDGLLNMFAITTGLHLFNSSKKVVIKSYNLRSIRAYYECSSHLYHI